MAVVMNIKTGEVLALSQYPSFDPNDYGKSNPDDLWVRAVTTPYTPGSVQKVLTLSALIDMGLITPTTVVKVPAQLKSGDQMIGGPGVPGGTRLYARGVLAKSSNTGTILLARKADANALRQYYVNFGLGARTGVGLPGEVTGTLAGENMPGYTRDGTAFGGSAVSVTLLQEAAAIAGIANGGVYNAPRLIQSITQPDGSSTEPATPAPRRVVSSETSADLMSTFRATGSGPRQAPPASTSRAATASVAWSPPRSAWRRWRTRRSWSTLSWTAQPGARPASPWPARPCRT
jgi:cell division protein FtsI (penicillin-binding protein 3)